MVESTISLTPESSLVDDIEATFKQVAALSTQIRQILNTGVGGNLIPVFSDFRRGFDLLYTLSSDHKSLRDAKVNNKVCIWRNTQGMSEKQVRDGLKLFEEYKRELFKTNILRFA